MRKASPDLLLDLPPAVRPGDRLLLPLFDFPLSYRLRRSGCDSIRVGVEGGDLLGRHAARIKFAHDRNRGSLVVRDVVGSLRLNWLLVLLSREMFAPVFDRACARDIRKFVQAELLSE